MKHGVAPARRVRVGRRSSCTRRAGAVRSNVADQLEIPQQTYANYEVARARIPASMLPELARIFGVGVDELLGLRNGSGKRGPTPKLQQQLERLSALPKPKQRAVMEVLEAMLAQAGRSA